MERSWSTLAIGTVLGLALLGSDGALAQWSDDAQKCSEIMDNLDLAIHYCTKAINSGLLLDKNLAMTFMNRGSKWDRKKEKDKALADYDAAIRIDPRNAITYSNRCGIWISKREHDKALNDCNEAIRLDPNYASAYLNRATIYFNKADYDRAAPDFDAAIRLKPDYAAAVRDRADIWYVKGDYDRAIAGFSEAIRLDPKDATTFYWRGDAWYFKSEFDRAIADYDASIALDSTNPNVFGIRGQAKFHKGQFAAAAADLAKAWDIEPTAWRAVWLYLARTREGQDARADLDKNAAKLTGSDWPMPVLSFYLGKIDHKALRAAAETDPAKWQKRVCEAQFYIGEQQLLRGQIPAAKQSFKAVADICPKNETAYVGALAELERLGK